MFNYKKGLLSLATVMALSSGVWGSGSAYLPLTSDTNDNRWVMFGVNGFKVEGGTTASVATFGTGTQLTDAGGDDVSTAGLSSGGNLAELKALNLATNGLSTITINVDITGVTFSATEPMRTMYIKAGGNSNADVLFKYKASLEGRAIEFQINSDTTKTYTTTISALNTYDNPATRTQKSESAATGGTPLDTISKAVDYDFLDNPLNPANYNSVANAVNSNAYQTSNSSASLRMYDYNAITGSWEIYDRANSTLANDFDTLKLGKAYWAKMDLNGNNSSDANTKAGLVLGTADLNSTSYSGEITTGWNLISFDGAIPDIRTSSTGMILTDAEQNVAITIADTTGINKVNVTLPGTSVADDAKAINMAVEAQKDLGNIPDTFNLRAFGSDEGTNKQLILISNKRFAVKDDTTNAFTNGTSLAGKTLWDEATNTLVDYSATTLPATFVRSVYGESGLVFKPLWGANTASQLDNTVATAVGSGGDNASAKIQIGTLSPVALADASSGSNAQTTLGTAVTQLNTITETGYNYNAVSMDFNNDGTDDYALFAADKTFYIRDYTFTRVMTYDATGSGNTIKITSPTPANITTASTIDATVTNINAVADASSNTGVYAAVTNTNDIVFVSSVNLSSNFNVIDDTTNDYLTDTSSSADIAKGAIKDVYSLNALAKEAVYPHIISIDVDEATDDGADTVQFKINGSTTGTTKFTSGDQITGATATTRKAMFDLYVSKLQDDVKALGLDAVVSHNYDDTETNLATALDNAQITISGYDVSAIDLTRPDNGGTTTETTPVSGVDSHSGDFGTFTATPAQLTSDLKYNAIYTPDYATDGPLYTLKDLGYTAKAIITGTANMSSGDIAWDNIDLTKSPTEWFANQDYNLFSIDGKAGYWVYLDNNIDTNSISIDNVTIHPSYTYQFNNDKTTNNRVGATIQMTVHGLPTDTTPVNVYANVGGSKVELTTSGTNGIYSGTLSSYEVNGLSAGNLYDITVSVADGTGYKKDNISIGSIDFEKPTAPTVTLGTGLNTALSSTSSDATGFYIYDVTSGGSIPEENTNSSSTKVVKVLEANASSFNLCADANAFGTYTYRAIALDGNASTTGAGTDAELGYGNASDATEFTYSATLKGADLLNNTQGVDTSASSLAVPYDTSCVAGTQRTTNTGISLKSIIADAKVKMSYVKKDNVSFTTNTPYTIYVGLSSAGVAEVKYVPAYAGSSFYIEIDGQLYSGTLPNDDTANGNSSHALDVSGNIVTGETLPN